MNKIELLKNAAAFLASAGVGLVVKNAISATTPLDIGRLGKASVGIGTFFVSGLLADKARIQVEERIDGIVETAKAGKQIAAGVKEIAVEGKKAFVEAKETLENTEKDPGDDDLIDPNNVTKDQADAIVASVERKPGESQKAYQTRIGAKVNEQKS